MKEKIMEILKREKKSNNKRKKLFENNNNLKNLFEKTSINRCFN